MTWIMSSISRQEVFYDSFSVDGPTDSHVPDKSTLLTGTYNVDSADFDTAISGGKLYYSGVTDYGVASYGQADSLPFSNQRNFVLSAVVNLGAYSALSYKAMYVLVRRVSGVYGMALINSDVTLYGVDSGSYTTSLSPVDSTDLQLTMTYGPDSVRFQFGAVDFSRTRQAPQSPVSNDYPKGFYLLLAASCTLDDLRLETLPS